MEKIAGAILATTLAGSCLVGGSLAGAEIVKNNDKEIIEQSKSEGYKEGLEKGLTINVGYSQEEVDEMIENALSGSSVDKIDVSFDGVDNNFFEKRVNYFGNLKTGEILFNQDKFYKRSIGDDSFVLLKTFDEGFLRNVNYRSTSFVSENFVFVSNSSNSASHTSFLYNCLNDSFILLDDEYAFSFVDVGDYVIAYSSKVSGKFYFINKNDCSLNVVNSDVSFSSYNRIVQFGNSVFFSSSSANGIYKLNTTNSDFSLCDGTSDLIGCNLISFAGKLFMRSSDGSSINLSVLESLDVYNFSPVNVGEYGSCDGSIYYRFVDGYIVKNDFGVFFINNDLSINENTSTILYCGANHFAICGNYIFFYGLGSGGSCVYYDTLNKEIRTISSWVNGTGGIVFTDYGVVSMNTASNSLGGLRVYSFITGSMVKLSQSSNVGLELIGAFEKKVLVKFNSGFLLYNFEDDSYVEEFGSSLFNLVQIDSSLYKEYVFDDELNYEVNYCVVD